MKYLVCIGLGIIIGFYLSEKFRTPCPYIEKRIDTIYVEKPTKKKETIKPTPIKTIKDKTYLTEAASDSTVINPCDFINVYSDTLEDSTGTIIVNDSVRGEILKKEIFYTPKIAYIKETREVEKKVPQKGLFIGFEAGGGSGSYRFAPEIEYVNKNGFAYSYNFDLFNRVHCVGIKKRINLR
jgi:hypothetical protein